MNIVKHGRLPVVGILGTNGTVSRTVATASGALGLAGANTGNLIYHFGAELNLRGPRLYLSLAGGVDWAQVRRSIDVLHIPAANQLNPEFDITELARIVDFLDKPVFIAGLGMQCELSESDADVVLQPGALQFLAVLQRLAPGIGVRGEATRRLLERHGVGHAVVTGCPSNFINPNISGATIQQALDRVRALPSPTIDFFPGTLSNHRRTEAKLRQLTDDFACRYVLQTNPDLFNFVSGAIEQSALAYLRWERLALGAGVSEQVYNQNYAERGTYYFSAPAWIDSVAQRDLGIGMRMHGVVATIQGGAAGVCVVSDGRIRELVHTMGYPHVSLDDVERADSLQALLEQVVFSPGEFDIKRQAAFQTYRQLADACGVHLNETGLHC